MNRKREADVGKQASDFRQGVEAAAKWLRGEVGVPGQTMATRMLAAVGEDPEGTEARTVAQIVQYLQEQELMADDDVASIALRGAAEDIARGDWKRS